MVERLTDFSLSVFSFSKIRLVRKLRFEFEIEDRTDEVHSQEVPFSPIAIPFTQNFERFDSGIDIFNHDPLPRQFAVEQLLLRRQRMIFARFLGNFTVFVQL